MMPVILYEQRSYSLRELHGAFQAEDSEIRHFIETCSQRKILDSKNGIFTFRYVGIMIYNDRLILFLPKYLPYGLKTSQAFQTMKVLIEVFKLYSARSIETDEFEMFGDSQNSQSFNLFTAIYYFMKDYTENGLYHKDKNELVLFGTGEIDWQRTIDEQTAYLSRNHTPVYLDLMTTEVLHDTEHYLTILHKSILNQCSKYLAISGLREFLDYPDVHFETEEYVLGSQDYQLIQIEQALHVEFQDRSIKLLRAFYQFISNSSFSSPDEAAIFYGTRSFHVVWEKCCAFVMGHHAQLNSLIPKPVWEDGTSKDDTKETLNPDIVRSLIYKQSKVLLILDAKYYTISFQKGKVTNQPGIGDIIKQYMYEKAFHEYMNKQKYQDRFNGFLFPSFGQQIKRFGQVSIPFLSELKPVSLIYVPADPIYKLYIRSQKWQSAEWAYFMNEIDHS